MRFAPRRRRTGTVSMDAVRAGGALLVHPAGRLDPRSRQFAAGLAADREHTLVVVDVHAAAPREEWEAVAGLLADDSGGGLRIVVGRGSPEETMRVSQWLADRLGRTVVAPDAAVLPAAGGGLFVPPDRGTGWYVLRPGREPRVDSRRFPRPTWEAPAADRAWATSDTGTAEPVPGGVWLRHTGVEPGTLAAQRRQLAAGVHAARPDLLTVLLGNPGMPGLPLDDIARFWDALSAPSRAMVRFAPFGQPAVPAGETVGQALADRLRYPVAMFTGLPGAGAPGTPGHDVRVPVDGTSPGWRPFAQEMGHRPRLNAGDPVDPPVLLAHRVPLDGLEPIGPGLFRYGQDAVLEVVQSGLWVRRADDPLDAEAVRGIPPQPEGGLILHDAGPDAARMRRIATEVLRGLDAETSRMCRTVSVPDACAAAEHDRRTGSGTPSLAAGPPAAAPDRATAPEPTQRRVPAVPPALAPAVVRAEASPWGLRDAHRTGPGTPVPTMADTPGEALSLPGTATPGPADPTAQRSGAADSDTPTSSSGAPAPGASVRRPPLPTVGGPAPRTGRTAPGPTAVPNPRVTGDVPVTPDVLLAPPTAPATPVIPSTAPNTPAATPVIPSTAPATPAVPSTPPNTPVIPSTAPASPAVPSSPVASSAPAVPSSPPASPVAPSTPAVPSTPPASPAVPSTPPNTPAAPSTPPHTPSSPGAQPTASGVRDIPPAALRAVSGIRSEAEVRSDHAESSAGTADESAPHTPGAPPPPPKQDPEPAAAASPSAPTAPPSPSPSPSAPVAQTAALAPAPRIRLESSPAPATVHLPPPPPDPVHAQENPALVPPAPAALAPEALSAADPPRVAEAGADDRRDAAGPGPESGVRVQPVPAAAACAVPPERGIDQERAWLQRTLGAPFDAIAGSVSRAMSELPGLRPESGRGGREALSDLVAVKLYLSGGAPSLDAGVSAGLPGPHVPLARCVAAGLRRLPSYRGPVRLRAPLTPAEWEWYRSRRLIVEWGFCSGDADPPPAGATGTGSTDAAAPAPDDEPPQGPGPVDFLVWSMTARRTALIVQDEADRVVFLPGTGFKVLRVTGGDRPSVLLRELSASEISEDGRVSTRPVPLDTIALASLETAGRTRPPAEAAERKPLGHAPGLVISGTDGPDGPGEDTEQ